MRDRELVPCPVCNGQGVVDAEFNFSTVEAECPYCGGDGKALRSAVERDGV